jgi:hypothetical protein
MLRNPALLVLADRAEELQCTPAAETLRRGGMYALWVAYAWRQSRDATLERLARLAWSEATEAERAEVLSAIR